MMSARKYFASLALCALAPAAYSHHSYAMFDLTLPATLHGTVSGLEWGNPHVWVWVVSTATRGAPATYGFETVSPGELVRFCRWSKRSLRIGDEVTVEYVPLRSGRNGGALKRILFTDGHVLETPLAHVGPPRGAAGPGKGASP
jgi:hypothetical protein